MDKLCLIFVKFGVSYFTDFGYKDITTTDIISIKEIGLKEATEIKNSLVEIQASSYQYNELNSLDPTSYKVKIIKNKASIKTYKECFDIKNGSYNSTDFDLIDMIKKNMLYITYSNIIANAEEMNRELGYSKNVELLGNLSNSLNDFYVISGRLSYQEFKSDPDFLDIVNDIENIQGAMALPSIKEEMSTVSNYENQLIGIIGSYLEPGL